MSYQQITFAVSERFAESLSDVLMDNGALSTAIEDAFAGTDNEQAIFGEPGMPVEQIWQRSKIIALFAEHADVAAIMATAAAALDLETPPYQCELLPEQDWVRLTQAQFDPIQISPRLWIVPSWHEAPDNQAINLKLDPGLAFGTGSHPTTHLCLQWLDQHLQGGESVLDYGCGSGILAIAALKLGAANAVGIDIDKQALIASKDNAQQNTVAAQFGLPEELPKQQQFDIVIANILANPLRALGELLANHVKTGGHIVLSGILAEQVDEMNSIYAQWFTMQDAQLENGWARLHGIKR